MKVLLVEDEEFIRDLFKRQLDLSGFTTDAFGTGNDGLAALGKNAYDLVLLDIMLPDINGLQILQTIRSKPETKGIAVVLLTNLGQDAVIKQGFELGADGYLVKAAYTPDQIVQEVKNIMQKKQAQNTAQGTPSPTGTPASASIEPSTPPTAGVTPVPGVTSEPTQFSPPVTPPSFDLEPKGAMMNPAVASAPGMAAIPGVNAAPIESAPMVQPTSNEVVSSAANPDEIAVPGVDTQVK